MNELHMPVVLVMSMAILRGSAVASDEPPLPGRGPWGTISSGLSCRVTPERQEYALGDQIRILVEIRNNTDSPITVGREPRVYLRDGTLAPPQPSQLWTTATQGTFFCTTVSRFPRDPTRKNRAKRMTILPGQSHSEIALRTPWGPVYSSIPAEATVGTMVIKASLSQFGSDDPKQPRKFKVKARPVTIKVKKAVERDRTPHC